MSFTLDDVRREYAALMPGETLLWKGRYGALSNAYSGGTAHGATTYEGDLVGALGQAAEPRRSKA